MVFMIMPSSTFLYMPSSLRYRRSLIHYWNIEKIYDFTPLMDRLWGSINIATIAVKVSNKFSSVTLSSNILSSVTHLPTRKELFVFRLINMIGIAFLLMWHFPKIILGKQTCLVEDI